LRPFESRVRAEHGPTPALARFEIDLLAWLGRPRDALELVREAALANPDRPDLQEELRSVAGQFEAKKGRIRAIRKTLERSPRRFKAPQSAGGAAPRHP
jgi:hypothetical protein